MSADGRYLAAAGLETEGTQAGRVIVWDTKTGQRRRLIEDLPPRQLWWVALSHDGRTLATGDTYEPTSGFGRVWTFDVPSGRRLWTSYGGCGPGVFLPDGTLAVSSDWASVKVVNVRKGVILYTLQPRHEDAGIRGLGVSRDGSILATASYVGEIDDPNGNGVIHVWNLKTRRLIRAIPQRDYLAGGVAVSPNCRTIAAAVFQQTGEHHTAMGRIRLYDIRSGRLKRTLRNGKAYGLVNVGTVGFGGSGRWVVANDGWVDEGAARIWDARSGRLSYTVRADGSNYNGTLSSDGPIMATGAQDRIKLWRLP